MNKNAFGKQIYTLKEIVSDAKLHASLEQTLEDVLGSTGVPSMHVHAHTQLLLSYAKEKSLEVYEEEAHALLERMQVAVPQSLHDRAERIMKQIRPYVHGNTILDLGCGDGAVGAALAKQGYHVELADVYEHPFIKTHALPFIACNQRERVPKEEGLYDNVLLLTVMHHSDDPRATLQDAKRLTKSGGRIIIIESVYGISDESPFGQLSHEEQFKTNQFFDHFYNRVLHYSSDPKSKVNVPFNFNTPKGWEYEFCRAGLKKIQYVPLGLDQPSVPEYHTLHVVQVP